MAKIITISGKSASGKNYIYDALVRKYKDLIPVVTHTTRPKRQGEEEGREYHFVNSKTFIEKVGKGEIFEYREYDTAHGLWYYGTSKEQIDMSSNNVYIAIVDIDGLREYINQFGQNNIVSYYVKTHDDIRLIRMLQRETSIDETKKHEILRRYKADTHDFKRAEDFCKHTVYNNDQQDFDTTLEFISYEIERARGV